MTSKIRVSKSIIAFSILGLAMALPSSAQTSARMTITDGLNTATLTPTTDGSTGTVAVTGPCVAANTCPTTSASFTAGSITWNGLFGNFYLSNLAGSTKPGVTGDPHMDLGSGQVALVTNGGSNGTNNLTVKFTDTGFTGGTGVSFGNNTVSSISNGTYTITDYVDNTNTAFGTGTTAVPTQSWSSPPLTSSGGSVTVQGIGPTATPFSMTQVATFSMTAASTGTAMTDSGFNVNTAPLTVVCPTTFGTVGSIYTATLTANGGVPPYTFSITNLSTVLPGWTLNSQTGALSSASALLSSGTLSFTAQVVDQSGSTANTASANCSITVNPKPGGGNSNPSTITVACPTTPLGYVNVPYSGAITETMGVSPFTFSATGLPPGLSVIPGSGAITGTPTKAGTYPFIATVTDSSSPKLTASTTAGACNITIQTLPPLSFVCPTGTGSVGSAYSSKITVTGGLAPYKFTATGLPAGLTLTTSSGSYGVISGTPTAAGSFKISITVTDSSGAKVGNSCSSDCTIVISCSSTSGSGTISGYVYDDLNGSKTYNNGDKAFQGVTVTLKASNGSTKTATSNSSGYYEFDNVPAGSYTLWAPSTAVGNETLDTSSSISVTVGGGNSYSCSSTSTNNNFGYVGSSTVTGKCYTNDYWGHSWGMGGQTITVSGKDCYGNNVKKTCNTDGDGNYSCSGLYPGSYTVSAPSSCNWQNGWHSIQTNSNLNIGCQSNDYHPNQNFCYNYGW